MEILGKTRVVVKDGKVVEVGMPLIQQCPLWKKVSGTEIITQKTAQKNMQQRIDEIGMFTAKRRLDLGVFTTFGVSEIMMTALRGSLIDSTVTVCDGAGTVVTSNPSLVQGMSAQISGLIETEPILEVIAGIQEMKGYVLDQENATIDQPNGLELAVDLGYKRIGVSVVDPDSALRVRDMGRRLGVEVIIMAAHLTGISRHDTIRLIKTVDIITSCASGNIRDMVKPLIQVGTAIPLFGLTEQGKEILIERAKKIQAPLLISTMNLPVLDKKKQPGSLVY